MEAAFQVPRKEILMAEIFVLVKLRFSLHLPPALVIVHLTRILEVALRY
jgi:hypothetical protein